MQSTTATFYPNPTASVDMAPLPPLSNEEEEILLVSIRTQLDYYFGPLNLSRDPFLQSLLTSPEHYGAVPVQTICAFPKIRQMNASMRAKQHVPVDLAPAAEVGLLCRAAEQSNVVRVVGDAVSGLYWFVPNQPLPEHVYESDPMDQTPPLLSPTPRMVSPTPSTFTNKTQAPTPPASPTSASTTSSLQGAVPTQQQSLRSQRTVVLVHELPDPAAESAIWDLFSSSAPKSVVQDAGRTWHVTFGTEEIARAALLTTVDKTIHGHYFHVGLKNENPPAQLPHPSFGEEGAGQHYQPGNQYGNNVATFQPQQQPQYVQENHQVSSYQLNPQANQYIQYGHVASQQYAYGYAVVPPVMAPQQGIVPTMVIQPPPPPPPRMMYANVPPHHVGYVAAPVAVDYGPSSHAMVSLPSQQEWQYVEVTTPGGHGLGGAVETKNGKPKYGLGFKKEKNGNNKDHKLQMGGSSNSSDWDAHGENNPNTNGGYQQSKKGYKNQTTKHKKKGGAAAATQPFVQENFPALGGPKNNKKSPKGKSKSEKAAYAKALLKPRSSKPTGQTSLTDIESKMQDLAVSEKEPSTQQSSKQTSSSS